MKKPLLLLITVLLLGCMLLAACNGETTPTSAPEPGPGPAPTSAPEPGPGPAPTSAPEPGPGPAPAPDDGKVIELNFSYHAPPPSGLARNLLTPWADNLEAACGGRIDIVHHAAGSLLSSSDAYDGVLSGICDLAQVSTEEYSGRLPRASIMAMPQLFPNTEICGVAYHEFLLKYAVDTELKGVKLMITLPMHPLQYMSTRETKVLEDFAGQKIRASGSQDTAIVEALGGTAVEVGTSDAFSALDTGLLDGQFFAFDGAVAFGIPDVCDYFVDCAMWISCFELLMNQNTFNKLPDDLKKIFDDFATVEATRANAQFFMATIPDSYQTLEDALARRSKAPIYVMPQSERDRCAEACAPLKADWIAKMEDKGLPGQEMMDYIVSVVEREQNS